MNTISIYIHHRARGQRVLSALGAVSLRICGEHGPPPPRRVYGQCEGGEKKNYNCHLSFVTRRLPPEQEQESALGKLPFCLR